MAKGFAAGYRATLMATAVLALTVAGAGAFSSAAGAAQGGLSARAGTVSEVPEATETAPAATSSLVGERAIAPADAPAVVKQVIAAANRISATPYLWGGGHGRWWDKGYDCSGSVSYALHGGGLLESPLVRESYLGL